MNREVGAIGWFQFEEAYLKIRSTNKEKRGLLAKLHYQIMKEDLLHWKTVRTTSSVSAPPTNTIIHDTDNVSEKT